MHKPNAGKTKRAKFCQAHEKEIITEKDYGLH